MAGIAQLNDIYKKKGKEFIEKLFDSFVTINVKLDANAFGVERNPVTKEIEFFKRNTDAPISKVDRTLVKYYEAPISYIQNLGEQKLSKLPTGWRFGMEYVTQAGPATNLVLTYIHVKNAMGKTVRTVQDKVELDKWADFLGIKHPPIIYQGVLSGDQRVEILDFLDTAAKDLDGKFGTDSFVKYLVMMLCPKMKSEVLSDDVPVEGIVFRFGSDDDDVVLAKVVDPMFAEMSKTRVNETDDAPNDIYYMTLIDLMNYIENLNFNKLKPKGKTFDERYLNFICDVFIMFVHDRGDDYKDIDFYEPAYMKRKEFDLNREMIPNDKVLALLDESDSYKKLFKIMLASLRRRKKKANNFFTKEVIRQFNGTVDKINSHLSQNLKESEVPLFSEFLDMRGRENEEHEEEAPEEPVDVAADFKSTMDQIAPEPEEEEKKPKKKGKKVNIIVGRFQPFHNGHLQMVKELYDTNKLPVVVVAIHGGGDGSENSPFSVSTLRTMLNNLEKDTDGMVVDFRVIDRGFITDIVSALRPDFEPVLWGVGSDRINDYRKQLELNFKKGNLLELNDKFEIMETDRIMSGVDVRKNIETDSFGKFKVMVPKTVQGMYPVLRNDIGRLAASDK